MQRGKGSGKGAQAEGTADGMSRRDAGPEAEERKRSEKEEAESEGEESGEEEEDEEGEGEAAPAKPLDGRAKKLAELRAKLNEARAKNHQAVLGEHKAQSAAPSRLTEEQKVAQAAWLAKVDRIRGEAEARGEDPEVYAMRSMTAEEAEAETKRQVKKKSGVFGWEVFSNDAHYRAHKKRTAGLAANDDEYEAQKASVANFYPEAGDLSYVSQPKVPQANVDRMARDLTEQIAKRKKFSRRRAAVGGEVDYINDKNRAFNKRAERAYGAYTAEIKQNLERGSAL